MSTAVGVFGGVDVFSQLIIQTANPVTQENLKTTQLQVSQRFKLTQRNFSLVKRLCLFTQRIVQTANPVTQESFIVTSHCNIDKFS